jgi:hypothetical protein
MSDDVILGVHSNVRKGQTDPETGEPYGFDAGHAWISVTRDGKITHYGLWPDAHPSVEDNGSASDIRTGMEDGDRPAASRYYRLNGEQAAKLEGLLKANETWGYTNNCSSWARDTVEAVTGVHLNADDAGVLWTETPRQLGDSIHRLEEKDRTSPEGPNTPPPAKGSSSLGSKAELSDISKQLLQDSEQHVWRVAEQNGLAWDQGMDNTVAAVARKAREDGLTGISHLKAVGGDIRFAQANGYGLRESALDARTAANTPAQESRAALALADERALSGPAAHASPGMEMAALQRA